MARGHKQVLRRSMSLTEWNRIRLAELEAWKDEARIPLSGWSMREADYADPDTYRFLGRWTSVREGDPWGRPDGTCFFRRTVTVPDDLRGNPVMFRLPTVAEMMVRIDGKLVNALDPNRSEVPLFKRARGGETLEIELEAYVRSAPDDLRAFLQETVDIGCVQAWRDPELVVPDDTVRRFLLDVGPPLDVASCGAVDSDVRDLLERRLHEALNEVDVETTDRRKLHRGLKRAGERIRETIYEAEGLGGPGRLALIGHSHLDVAYHWRVRQGIRKNARTTVVQLALMDEYPDMRYCHTQPFLYESLKQFYPDLYRRMKRKIRDGQWEIVGAPYVEPDCNIPSGESLIRQCLLGKLFCMEEFGVDVDTFWVPDVFGNSWIMPQILDRCGIRYFVSNKMSTWNDTNRFPHNTFHWKGIDGTSVRACVPASHFISWLAPDQLLANWDGFQEKAEIGESLNMFGFGDGGGGLTREMMETVRRMESFPGLPKTRLTTAQQALEDTFRNEDELATWDGELYLEMHRGTFTTKGDLKRLNRRCEAVAREAEQFSVLADRDDRDALTAAWKRVLVNQFHDILPGSHTEPVGREAVESYEQSLADFTGVRDASLNQLAAGIDTTVQAGKPVVVFNSLTEPRTGVVRAGVEGGSVVDVEGRPVPSQIAENGGLLFTASSVPALGYAAFFIRGGSDAPRPEPAHPARVENRFFRVRIDENGQLSSVYDKRANREALPRGETANVFQLFEDKPGLYDAWDIIRTYRDREYDLPPAETVDVVETGPVRTVVRVKRSFFDSALEQRIIFYEDIPRIDFETSVDWRERHRLLKVAFPVDVLAREATYDLSYGAIRRPTHENTSWDEAKFEVCGHQWADLSEDGYGVSVLNDSKYGWDIRGHTIRLSLLRGPIRPDPRSDLGAHRFTYSLFPHAGSWQDAGTAAAAADLNAPLIPRPARRRRGEQPPRGAYLSVEGRGVVLGALKRAERGDGIVLRLAERHGGRTTATVRWDRMERACECDLLEREERSHSVRGGRLRTALTPYRIRSFLVQKT
jgi:alpha-mannosidase